MEIPPWIKVACRHAYRSLREFLFLAFFSFMPVWLGVVMHYLLSKGDVPRYLQGYLVNGEALLLSASTVGPLVFLLVNSEESTSSAQRRFPLRWAYYLLISAVCAIAAALIGLRALPGSDAAISRDAMWILSCFVSVLSVLLWFAVVGTNSAHENGAPEIMRQEAEDFTNNFREAR